MTSRLLTKFYVLQLLLCFSHFLFAQEDFHRIDKVEQQQRLDRGLSALREENFHGALAIKLPGKSAAYFSFGRVENIEFSPESLQIDLLSITKTITGAAIMKLVDDGELEVEQPITDFFPDVPTDKVDITIHHLLTHSSGLRGSIGSDDTVISRDDYISRAMRSKLRFDPGTSYEYSNTGFSLLAAIIELVSEKNYEKFIREDLLPQEEALRMGYAEVFDSVYSLRTRRGRDISEASWGHEIPYWNLIGNGGMVADIGSVTRFLELLTSGELLSAKSTQTMFTGHQQEFPDDSFYGYGVVIDKGASFKRFNWHNGGNNSFNSWWSYHVDHDVLIFVASAGRFDADEAAETLLLALFGDSL